MLVVIVIAAAGVTLLRMLRSTQPKPPLVHHKASDGLDEGLPPYGPGSIDQMLALAPEFETAPLADDLSGRFVMTLITSGFAIGFNWLDWKYGEGRLLIDDPSLLDSADLITIRKFFTFLWRQDHFCEGVFQSAIGAGIPQRALRRLAAIRKAG